MKPFLSIVIPAYNEAERLPETLALTRDWVERQPFAVEIVVVDAGSTDVTVPTVREIQARFPNLRLIENAQNKGKASVVAQGMLAATGTWRLFMDADGSTPLHEINRLFDQTDTYQVVIGSRYLHPDSVKIKQPWKRRVISRSGNLLIRASLLPGIRDTQCGFKLFSAEAAEAIFPRMTVAGWLFDVEVLLIARRLHYAIKEVPVDWYDAKSSKLRAVQASGRALQDWRKIRRQLKTGSYEK